MKSLDSIPTLPAQPAVLVRLTTDDYLKVAWLAQTDGQSMGGYVRVLVRRHLEERPATSTRVR